MNVILRDTYVDFPFVSFFAGPPRFKKNVPMSREIFFGPQNVSLLDLGIYPSHHCSNAICPYPAPMVSEFSVRYLCFLTYGGGHRLGISLAMLAMLRSGSM